jgi:hypothetical protein
VSRTALRRDRACVTKLGTTSWVIVAFDPAGEVLTAIVNPKQPPIAAAETGAGACGHAAHR